MTKSSRKIHPQAGLLSYGPAECQTRDNRQFGQYGAPAVNLTGGLGTREEIRFRYQALEGEGDLAAVTRHDGEEADSADEQPKGRQSVRDAVD